MRSCERAVQQPVSRSSGLPTDTAACRGRIAQPIESRDSCGIELLAGGWRAHQVSVAGRRVHIGDGACLVAPWWATPDRVKGARWRSRRSAMALGPP
jgi:hypothetical protein